MSDANFTSWDPSSTLNALTSGEVHFSSGFLNADFDYLFQGLKLDWVPLFTSIGAKVLLTEVNTQLSIPSGLDTVFNYTVDSNPCIIAIDSKSQKVISEAVSPNIDIDQASYVTIEYLIRRLLYSLAATWSGLESPYIKFESKTPSKIEILGVVKVSLEVNDKPVNLAFGLDLNTTELIHKSWIQLKDSFLGTQTTNNSTSSLSIEIDRFNMDNDTLISAIVPGSVIKLNKQEISSAMVKVDGNRFFECSLKQYNNCYGVKVGNGISPKKIERETFSVELLQLNLPSSLVKSRIKNGSILMFDKPLNSPVLIVIEGETVGFAKLGSINGEFVIIIDAK